tara:strand:- start:10 stop:1155 length:1146 start_codon:yes stop_codon:yes gene_type:complete
MNNKLTYLTYQTFPAETANSIQSISMIKYFIKNGFKLTLVFPNRSEKSTEEISELKKFYNFSEDFEIRLLKHNYLFKDYKKKVLFKKFRFNISHFFWAKSAVKNIIKSDLSDNLFFTRSDWVFYFLTKKNKKVIFECHQVSKIRKFVINSVKNSSNSKIIFTSELLSKEFRLNNNYIVLPNAYDEEFFDKKKNKRKENQIVFVGNLLRFNSDRNIKFLIKTFQSPKLNKYKLVIVGGPNSYKEELIKSTKLNNQSNIKILGQLNREETINIIEESVAGVLINSSSNKHSTHHTSPLKYFEYLRGGLKILAVDFPSHRDLPFAENILYFEENNEDSLIKATADIPMKEAVSKEEVEKFSYNSRVHEIMRFIARLEGFEPPTL